ncbi:hypothetical protein HYC85_011026 [Camellia sinensis]|uniref:Uncharacterized protein n=1 Tax=Camellia sinensis TaxID=4442 RepID=A0A7J7HJL1_CAMSI|nr:hypothetical protein HYC85_011026 [Camellia sinensis]
MMSCRMLLIMSVTSFGVLVVSYEEIDINWIGVIYQMGGVVGEALRLIFMEIFVKRKGLKLNYISVMYYVSPYRHPKMDAQGTWSFQPVILTLNSLCTFALNLSVFHVISHTNALAIRVTGVVKDWVVTISPSVCRYNADNDKSVWLWHCHYRLIFDDIWKHTCKSRSSVDIFCGLILSSTRKSRSNVIFFVD